MNAVDVQHNASLTEPTNMAIEVNLAAPKQGIIKSESLKKPRQLFRSHWWIYSHSFAGVPQCRKACFDVHILKLK